jgi:hypothetical protein
MSGKKMSIFLSGLALASGVVFLLSENRPPRAAGALSTSIAAYAPKGSVSEQCPDYIWEEVPGATRYDITFDIPKHVSSCPGEPGVPVTIAAYLGSKSRAPNVLCFGGAQRKLVCAQGRCTFDHRDRPGYIHRPKMCDGRTNVARWSVKAVVGNQDRASSGIVSYEWTGETPCRFPDP